MDNIFSVLGMVSAEPIVEDFAITTFSDEMAINTPADSALVLTKDMVGTFKSIIRFFIFSASLISPP